MIIITPLNNFFTNVLVEDMPHFTGLVSQFNKVLHQRLSCRKVITGSNYDLLLIQVSNESILVHGIRITVSNSLITYLQKLVV